MHHNRHWNIIQGLTTSVPDSTLHELLAERTKTAPDAYALHFGDVKITYGELQQKINQVTHYLWSQGLRPNQRVAISLDRSPELIIAIFAVLQSGAAYIPIDKAYPQKRIALMIDDSDADFFICDSTHAEIVEKTKTIVMAEALTEAQSFPIKSFNHKVASDSAAYIIYTSGSTGTPKGVQVAHRNVINLVYSMGSAPGISSADKVFAITTISFDAMVMEIFLPLIHGACVMLVDDPTRRDGEQLLRMAAEKGITLMWGTPTLWQILLDAGWENPLDIKVLIGGEAVPFALAQKLRAKCREVWNIYGPTETTVCTLLTKIEGSDDPITVGKPIANTYIYLLDDNGNPVAPGRIGEIAIGGAGVSLGYLNRAELTAERFVLDAFQEGKSNKLYLSGDLGKLLPNGQVQCLGRIDNQVKVRGHRIELGEIETVLNSLTGINRASVIVSDKSAGAEKLVAYLQSSDSNEDTAKMRAQLTDVLPDYMIPTIFMWVKDFPITENGKIDKKNLPIPKYTRPDSAPLLKKPRTPLEKKLAKLWSEQLQIPEIGIDDNFFQMGGTSLLTQKVSSLMKKKLQLNVAVTKLYQYPTIATISEFLEIEKVNTDSSSERTDVQSFDSSIKPKTTTSQDVAIIGMAGRFPGAASIPELWEILQNGKETITFFTSEELDPSIPKTQRDDPLYVKARGIVPSAKAFDAAFFGLNPKLASAMDPQQRIFMEIAWETLEQTGHLPKNYKGKIGVYAGAGTNTYYKNNIFPNKELIDQVGQLQTDTVNEKDYIAPRTAYHLNLTGPAVSVHSACSTSLLAVAEAVEAIRSGQCDVALAGGSSITAPMHSGHYYQEGSMLSADGHCRSFDAMGTGTVFSDGAGVVLLKNLTVAEKDGDEILGIIKGVGINNDGANKGSFTAPSTQGQADAITSALRDAQITPSEISYIEAHGTATPLGDPIEIEGLKLAFGKQQTKNYCALGSIKSNMGHLTAAAGVAGLIKTILAIKYRQIPPSLGFTKPNPGIDFKNSPFFVNDQLLDWEKDGLRKAGVSSFGVGGTNVHVIIEEYPEKTKKPSTTGRPLQLITWSAKTETSLKNYGSALEHYFEKRNPVPFADIAYSLNVTRESFSQRSFLLLESQQDSTKTWQDLHNNNLKTAVLEAAPGKTVFLFPGQGSQFMQMGRALYEHEKTFREAVEECAVLLLEDLKLDIRDILFPETETPEVENRLHNTKFTQPAIFVIEYALAKLWISWGIKPNVLCGHSIGEFVAAHLAGVFSLKDILHLIAFRGQLVSTLPDGSMLSVRLAAGELREILPTKLSIAASNSEILSVVAGTTEEVNAFAKTLKQQDIPSMQLSTSHAFHSAMMDPVIPTFKMEVERVHRHTPNLPIISTVTGTWLTDAEATDPNYWANHMRASVNFTGAVNTLMKIEDPHLLEVGPGRGLTTLTRRKKEGEFLKCTTSLPVPKNDENAYHGILNALGQLWLQGLEPNWTAFYAGQNRQKIALPSYVFDRKPCWVDPPKHSVKAIQEYHIAPEKTININENNAIAMRKQLFLQKIAEIISNTSGIDLEAPDYGNSFLELGLDSLILTQMALTCKKEFDLPITFRQLNEELATPDMLADYLSENLTDAKYAPAAQNNTVTQINGKPAPAPLPYNLETGGDSNSALGLISQQLQLIGKQVALLQGGDAGSSITPTDPPVNRFINIPSTDSDTRTEEEKIEHKKPFGASPRIEKQSTGLDAKQHQFLEDLITRYNKKTASSKSYAQKHRQIMADPRVVSGFKPLTKALVYPLVIKKSAGNRLWDLDGNEYIDALNGFGSCLFGHQPDFIKEALHDQVELGYEVGPQHPLAGEVCELLCEFTGHDRAALCNTGSEAVLGAMRIARTVTGRSLIVAFSGAYHGINDEAIVRGSRKFKTFPAAAGIQPGTVQNMLILDYGTEESLNIIRERAHELAAVLIEPVQSRRPEFQPVDFLKEIRQITEKAGSTLIFDEVITGFRMHPGGAQALFGIKADVAAYGKVIGGGLPIGAIMGEKKYMDALDGGFWEYGDDSFPEVGVTYFAGTFVRHPLALAATKASLIQMKEQGPDLQKRLTAITQDLAMQLNIAFATRKIPMQIVHFGSLWRLKLLEEIPHSDLLFVLMREKGIHILDGFPCFLTTSYTEMDVDQLISKFIESIDQLITAGFFGTNVKNNVNSKIKPRSAELNMPPIPGARLGRDGDGNPAWFIADSRKDGEYVKIDL